jgi:hypothetical protein
MTESMVGRIIVGRGRVSSSNVLDRDHGRRDAAVDVLLTIARAALVAVER